MVLCLIILNIENEPPLPPKRKLLSPPPSEEMTFRPCLKMIKRQSSYVDRPQGIRYIPAPSKPSVFTTGKKHDFPYRDEKEKEIKLQRNMSEVNTVKREFKLMANIGFVKKNDNIPNHKLVGMSFIRDQFGLLRMDDDYISGRVDMSNLTKKQIRDIQRKQSAHKEREFKKDIDYVSNLNKWEQKVFPSIKQKN